MKGVMNKRVERYLESHKRHGTRAPRCFRGKANSGRVLRRVVRTVWGKDQMRRIGLYLT